ncbi:zinc-ribbon domain-containing protein [Dehalogenimonas formicexedens]|uniref:Zinc-ribbon domain-containing protein n=1 Tax=Dehalogenimonas formicexedens TaxID=1839801 RepID=A0A1P8F5I8_9CHLR|nr:zinc ribbon domain-containing protein [Dehalogenimonas formicexedens]APV43741.1 zinc-ribbon domain-containing protein [Dehalogenimonas formicexedens]
MYCSDCGAILQEGDVFCSTCGVKVSPNELNPTTSETQLKPIFVQPDNKVDNLSSRDLAIGHKSEEAQLRIKTQKHSHLCEACGKKLSFTDNLKGARFCKPCKEIEEKKIELAKIAARQLEAQLSVEAHAIIMKFWRSEIEKAEAMRRLGEVFSKAPAAKSFDNMKDETFREIVDEILVDNILSVEEETKLKAIAELLTINFPMLEWNYKDIFVKLFIARINDGRLPIINASNIVLKKNEIAHMAQRASLLKQVNITEYQGGYSGVSFRVMKGVRFSTGGVRGRRVVVGTKMQEDDSGSIVATSQRIVFLGDRKTIEVPYSKLISLEIFEDGIRVHASNRQSAPLFTLENGNTFAAVVNRAAQ